VDIKRILVDTHIFQSDRADMAVVEARIRQVDASFVETARAFTPLTIMDGEGAVWTDLQRQVAGIEAPIEQALLLSRENRDREARALVMALDQHFGAIEHDAAALVNINVREANAATVTASAQQRESLLFAGALTLLGVVLSVIVVLLVTRLISSREAQLRRSWGLLEERNRDLDAFAGRVAHDLRGPLTTISLAASRLGERAPGENGTSSVLQRGVARMETLIGDLLTLSRIGAEVGGASCDPATVARAIYEEAEPRLHAEGGAVRVDVHPSRVRCSEGLLHQALWNLVDNGLKYRRAGEPPEITISGRRVAGRYELRVVDRGIGMSPEEARQAFEPFYRASEARQRPGTGLGLSIVKRVVEFAGGSVLIESRSGEGTTFIIRIPLDLP
jgi:signal transduction histidine kinase